MWESDLGGAGILIELDHFREQEVFKRQGNYCFEQRLFTRLAPAERLSFSIGTDIEQEQKWTREEIQTSFSNYFQTSETFLNAKFLHKCDAFRCDLQCCRSALISPGYKQLFWTIAAGTLILSELHNLAEWRYSEGGRLRPGLILISDEAVKREAAAFRGLLSGSILMDFLLFCKWEDSFIFTSNHWISVSSTKCA